MPHNLNTSSATISTANHDENMPSLFLLAANDYGVKCRWTGIRAINSFLNKKTKNVDYRWIMDNDGAFSCLIYYSILRQFISLLDKHNIDTSVLKAVKIPDNYIENERRINGKYINVVGKTDDSLWCEWGYNKDIQTVLENFIKGKDYRWRKTDTGYTCVIYKNALQRFINELDEIEIDVTEMERESGLRSTLSDIPDTPLPKLEYPLKENIDAHIPFQVRKYQFEDAKRMLALRRVLNANEMGCGKTLESIMVGESLPFPKLVICPATLRLNWRKEIRLCNPQADIKIILNSDDFVAGADWTIIGFSSLDKHLKQLIKHKFCVVFIDEAHYIKSVSVSGIPDSARAKATIAICEKARYVYPITGTPKTGCNKDIFNILRLIKHPLAINRSFFLPFAEKFCDLKEAPFGMTANGNTNNKLLYREIKPYMIRHLKSEVLPDITKIRSFLPVSVDLDAYNLAVKEYMDYRMSQGKTQAEELVLLQKLKITLASMKVDSTLEFCKNMVEQDEKIVVVTCYKEVVKRVLDEFGKDSVKLAGGMTDKSKESAIDKFQTGNAHVLVMNIIAGGVGINLTSAHVMVINDFDWVPANHVQAEDRIARSGQEQVANIYYLYVEGAEIDEVIADVLSRKLDTINTVVDGGNGEKIDIEDLIRKALIKKTD